MRNLERLNHPYGDDKVIDACSLFGVMDITGRRFSSRDPVSAIANMHERGNGLGGGFAIYGLYPEYEDYYAFHVMYTSREAKERADRLIAAAFDVIHDEEVPTDSTAKVWNPPLVWRYFLEPPKSNLGEGPPDDYVMQHVTRLNTETNGAFVFSSGKDMGVFKGVGFPEDMAQYFRLDEYEGYLWVCHGRFPTNSPGWWGGAHPFNMLDWSVVHNGELSSYGINRRYLEMYGYRCAMQTDTEVLAYALDLLMRRQGLPIETASRILAPPLWLEIDAMNGREKTLYAYLRQCYSSLLMNGPFSIIAARNGEMIGLTDRLKLRPLTAATAGERVYLSSEEAAIRLVSSSLERIWSPRGGEPVVARLGSAGGPS